MNKTLNILFIIEAAGGGAGRHVCDLSEALAKEGYQIHVIYSSNRNDAVFLAHIKEIPNVTFYPLPMHRKIMPADAATLKHIIAYAKTHGPFDIVHGHGSKGGVFAALVGLMRKTAVVYTAHGFATNNVEFSAVKKHFFKWIIRGISTVSRAVICVSDYEKKHALEFIRIPEKKLAVIHNSIAPYTQDKNAVRETLGLHPNDFCVGCVAMFYPSKGVDFFITAIADILHHIPKLKPVIVGSGPLKNMLHSKAKTLGIFDKIRWIENAKGQDIMPAFDLMVLPSKNESFPYVLLEALQAGVPVVASNVGGVSEIIEDKVNGFLVEPNQPYAIVSSLRNVIDNPAALLTLKGGVESSAKQFTLEMMVEKTLALYRQAVHKN